jgi:hypothetical protein
MAIHSAEHKTGGAFKSFALIQARRISLSRFQKERRKTKDRKEFGKNKETIEAISPVLSACDSMERSGHERDGGICKGQNGPKKQNHIAMDPSVLSATIQHRFEICAFTFALCKNTLNLL